MAAVLPAPPHRSASPPAGAARGSTTGWVAVALGALGTGLLVARAQGLTPPACALRAGVGLPCPVCGTTRLGDALVHGHVAAASTGDPVGVLLLVLLAVAAVGQVAALRGRVVPWLRGRPLPLALGALLLARWATVLLGGGPGPS